VLFERARLGWLATPVDGGRLWLVVLVRASIRMGRVAAVVVVVRIIIAAAWRVRRSRRAFCHVVA